jgi:hypothetical protein
MEKHQPFKTGYYEWPYKSSSENARNKRTRKSMPRKSGPNEKETPEEMIRSMQGIFCKGRYRSWLNRR